MLLLFSFNNSPHAMVDAAFIQSFVCRNLVCILGANSNEEESPLPTVYGYLSDNFVKALII